MHVSFSYPERANKLYLRNSCIFSCFCHVSTWNVFRIYLLFILDSKSEFLTFLWKSTQSYCAENRLDGFESRQLVKLVLSNSQFDKSFKIWLLWLLVVKCGLILMQKWVIMRTTILLYPIYVVIRVTIMRRLHCKCYSESLVMFVALGSYGARSIYLCVCSFTGFW